MIESVCACVCMCVYVVKEQIQYQNVCFLVNAGEWNERVGAHWRVFILHRRINIHFHETDCESWERQITKWLSLVNIMTGLNKCRETEIFVYLKEKLHLLVISLIKINETNEWLSDCLEWYLNFQFRLKNKHAILFRILLRWFSKNAY